MRLTWLVFLGFAVFQQACGSSPAPQNQAEATNAASEAPSGTGFLPPPTASDSNTVSADPNTPASNPNALNPNSSNPNTPSADPNTVNPNKPLPLTYTADDLTQDMNNVLQHRSGIYSNRDLGNPANVALWTPDKIQTLYAAILTSQAHYFPMLSVKDVAHAVLALGAADSTGDYTLVSGGTGYAQVSGNTQQDFINHGVAIQDANNSVLADPTNLPTGQLDDPGTSVALFAWETRNTVSANESPNEIALGVHNATVVRDFGNVYESWLCGPKTDRHTPSANSCTANNWPDFQSRLEDYFVQAGFGDVTAFTTLLNTAIPATLVNFKDPGAGF